MPFHVIQKNIVTMQVDAIVNAANTALKAGEGVCKAIFNAAGHERLQQACDRIGHCAVGEAVATDAFALTANYVIHTPGPIYIDGNHNEERLLHACYISSLSLASTLDCSSIAFPLISSGIYGYPKDQAIQTAIRAINEFLQTHEMQVYLVLYDRDSYELATTILNRETR